MDPHSPASIVPRARRRVVLLLPVVLAAAIAGCGHRRTSLRPVYVAPSPAAVAAPGCTTPGCTTTAEPSAVEPPAASPAVGGPSTPALDAEVGPATTSPPRPSQPDEPPLELNPATGGEKPPTAKPGPAAPGTSYRDGQRNRPWRLRQTSLRNQVRPFVKDPDDLFTPPKADRPWKYVVLHHSAKSSGGYDQIDRDHRQSLGWAGCGYHFVIGNGTGSPDGQIEVAQRWVNQKHGVHCRNGKSSDVNEYGVGICLVGDLDKTPPTPRQIEAAKALVAYLGERYTIPANHIGTHADLADSPSACPGKHFPAQAILGSRNLASR